AGRGPDGGQGARGAGRGRALDEAREAVRLQAGRGAGHAEGEDPPPVAHGPRRPVRRGRGAVGAGTGAAGDGPPGRAGGGRGRGAAGAGAGGGRAPGRRRVRRPVQPRGLPVRAPHAGLAPRLNLRQDILPCPASSSPTSSTPSASTCCAAPALSWTSAP